MSDCEEISLVGLAQEVNAWTSAAYGVFGAVLLVAAMRRRLTSGAVLLGMLVIAEGFGSFAYHGRPGDPSRWLHDVALLGLIGAIAGWHLGRLRDSGDRGLWIGGLGITAAAGIGYLISPEFTNATVAFLIATIIGAEVIARRRGRPAAFGWGLPALSVIAIVVYILGRTDGPLCDPTSRLQWHGLWHVLTAFAVFVWADRALAARGPAVGSGIGRSVADSIVGLVAVALVRAFHRRVSVSGHELIPRDRPVLLVANHGNGFVDPVVITSALRSMPRFIAKAALWKIPPARILLDALAVLPVYRSSDGDDRDKNRTTFDATTRALARDEIVAIFPEGTTGDRAQLDRVRSGAARIALGARGAGVEGIVIIPVGLAFESRVRTRTRAAVQFGTPIDLDAWHRAQGSQAAAPSPRQETVALTETIRDALVAVSPVHSSVDERERLRLAAAISLRAEDPAARTPDFGSVVHRAGRLAAAPVELRSSVVYALAEHALQRELIGLDDADLAAGPLRRSGARLAAAAIIAALLGPLLLTAALIHLPTVIAVQLAVASVTSTATKGTVRLLVGLATAMLTWWVVGMFIADGATSVAVVMAILAGLSAVALATWTWLIDAVSILRHAFRARDRRQLVPGLHRTRDQLVTAVHRAMTGAG